MTRKKPMYMVGDSVTLADIYACCLAYTYVLNEKNVFYHETKELIERPEYALILEYFIILKEVVFTTYFLGHRKGGHPY